MTIDTAMLETWRPRALAVLRIVTGYLLIPHGTAKLFGAPHQAMFDGLQLMSLMGLAGVIEVFGGALFLIGLFTRPVAFVLCGFMAVAYFMAHGSQGTRAAADAQPGRARGARLLRVPLLRFSGRRRMERGRGKARQQNGARHERLNAVGGGARPGPAIELTFP